MVSQDSEGMMALLAMGVLKAYLENLEGGECREPKEDQAGEAPLVWLAAKVFQVKSLKMFHEVRRAHLDIMVLLDGQDILDQKVRQACLGFLASKEAKVKQVIAQEVLKVPRGLLEIAAFLDQMVIRAHMDFKEYKESRVVEDFQEILERLESVKLELQDYQDDWDIMDPKGLKEILVNRDSLVRKAELGMLA